MLDPDDLARDVKSMDSRLETLVSELKKANIQTLEVRESMERLSRDNVFIKTILEETKYTIVFLTLSSLDTTIVPYSNSSDPDETPSNSTSHPDPSCLTLRQNFHQL